MGAQLPAEVTLARKLGLSIHFLISRRIRNGFVVRMMRSLLGIWCGEPVRSELYKHVSHMY